MTVNVLSGASVTGTVLGINLGDNTTIDNRGDVFGGGVGVSVASIHASSMAVP